MAAVDRRGCDGCGRTLPIDELSAVTLAGTEQAVCCPRCREHMESVVDEASTRSNGSSPAVRACSGCGESYPVTELTAFDLPDGETVACCTDCAEHARSLSQQSDVSGDGFECSGCGDAVPIGEREAVELDDGTTIVCCEECAEYARAATKTTTDGGSRNRRDSGGWQYDQSGGHSTQTDTATTSTSGSDESAALALAESPSVCDQCGDWVDVELFEVVTIDDRTEAFCPQCKDRARKKGVVKEVRMRRREAFRTLDLSPGVDETVVRDAYLSKIKRVHPDTKQGSKEAFRRVQRAYERLTD